MGAEQRPSNGPQVWRTRLLSLTRHEPLS